MLTCTNKILVINSDRSELEKVEKFINDVFEENKINVKHFNRVMLCVSEAVVNAIEHGNKNDTGKPVTIKVNCDFDHIHIKIEDEGQGFDPEKIEDPTLNENIKKESGRGIHIIRKLSNSLKYNQSGNSVQLKIDCK